MTFTKFAKEHGAEVVFGLLIAAGLYLYFVVYMTPSRLYWYRYMKEEIQISVHTVLGLRHKL